MTHYISQLQEQSHDPLQGAVDSQIAESSQEREALQVQVSEGLIIDNSDSEERQLVVLSETHPLARLVNPHRQCFHLRRLHPVVLAT